MSDNKEINWPELAGIGIGSLKGVILALECGLPESALKIAKEAVSEYERVRYNKECENG